LKCLKKIVFSNLAYPPLGENGKFNVRLGDILIPSETKKLGKRLRLRSALSRF